VLVVNYFPTKCSGTETVVSILGINKSLSFKQAGNDCIIDPSGMQPFEMSAELFVITLKNALQVIEVEL
jgi:hypothetical protein